MGVTQAKKKNSGRKAPTYPWSLDTTHPESKLRCPSQHRVESSTMNLKCLHYRGMDGSYLQKVLSVQRRVRLSSHFWHRIEVSKQHFRVIFADDKRKAVFIRGLEMPFFCFYAF